MQDLLDGKEVIRKGMTEEIDRCVEAYEQASLGKTVALIASGDIGIYGMAGPTFEVLLQAGWMPSGGVAVEVIPGATALNACAALVGAPLTHDFCAISLSDLLTPWPVIARRLEAAARGDFVVTLYNPKGGRRTRQIVEAQAILLRHRSPETPVAVVKSGYRRQSIQMTSLARMADCEIGMLCTVLIGNSATFVREGLMITPRGYAHKYEGLTGEAKDGERAGRPLGMGLADWHACVRKRLREQPELSLRDAATVFDAPLGEIFSAIGAQHADDEAGAYSALRFAPEATAEVIEASRDWGRLRAVARSEGGATAELLLDGGSSVWRGHWLNLVDRHFHLHVDGSRIAHAWFLSRGDQQHGIHFLDRHGAALVSLSLVKRNGRFDETALRSYRQARERFGQRHVPLGEIPETVAEPDE